MGIASLLLTHITHPTEIKALITYKVRPARASASKLTSQVWRDPLRSIEENPETSGWYRPLSVRLALTGAGTVRT